MLNFNGSGGPVTVDLGAETITENSPVAYSGIETINLDAGGVSPTVVGTSVDDDITVTVYDANSGKIERVFGGQQGRRSGSRFRGSPDQLHEHRQPGWSAQTP